MSSNQTSGNGAESRGIHTVSGDVTIENNSTTRNRTSGFNADGGGLFVSNTAGNPTQDITHQALNALATVEPSVDGTYTAVNGLPQVASVIINDGSASRSQITSVSVVFDKEVDHASLQTAFALTNVDNNAPVGSIAVAASNSGGKTTVVLTCSGASTFNRIGTGELGDSLADGNYRLNILSAQVVRADTGASMAADYIFGGQTAGQPNNDNFFRQYGDGDGDGNTDFLDFSGSFLPAFGNGQRSPGFRADMDHDGDGNVDFLDFSNGFLTNFGTGRA